MKGPYLGDDPLATLRHALREPRIPGIAVEFGVASGKTAAIIAEHLPIVGFDSFDGLPEAWRPGFPKGMFARPTPPPFPGELVVGWFADTLPGWEPPEPVAFVHIDCDLYSSTVTVLQHMAPHLRPGVVVVFDEHHGYEGWEDHEAKAWAEYTRRTGTQWSPIGHGPEQLALRIESSSSSPGGTGATLTAGPTLTPSPPT